MKLSICVLAYGDYPALLKRCLGSLSIDWDLVQDVRIGLNGVSPRTRQVADAWAALPPVPVYVVSRDKPCPVVGGYPKYPMMRRLFYGLDTPLAPLVTWFDDDSYQIGSAQIWPVMIDRFVGNNVLGQIGELWFKHLTERQLAAIKTQGWYTGRAIVCKGKIAFSTGGWWVARTAILRGWHYPFQELKHNGGDTMLGALLHQQAHQVDYCAESRVKVNKALRRGLDTSPLWEDYTPGVPPDVSHQVFDVSVSVNRKRICTWTSSGSV